MQSVMWMSGVQVVVSASCDSILYTFKFRLFILQLTKLYCSYLNKRPRIFS